ncbi:hypothetical protein APHAL10511_000499 [Amanita phalloides]|nr:hypothetical protein APHAL10511_000499 [Amanita phalloides]
MLRTVATKIAHNSTIPALAGNSDLRPLQDLITAEKAVLVSLQRLSSDVAKASEALRLWGLGEGDDLGDTLSASANILTHYSSALAQFASHGHRMRDQLKAIRTREEALDDLRRRRKTVMSNADSAEKKLSKMSPENKHLGQQQDTLNRLKNEIRSLDADILAEEAALGDFKRSQIKTMMGLKFGGLLECSEKGMIAGEYGKLVIAEIPEEITPPGAPRVVYYGHNQTENLIAEAHRRVSEVVLSTTVPFKGRQPMHANSQPTYDNSPWAQDNTKPTGAKYLATPEVTNGTFLDPSLTPLSFDTTAALSHRSSNYELGDRRGNVDDFGTSAWSLSANRFNTYPPKIGLNNDEGKDYSRSSDLPMLHSELAPFSTSVTEALSTIGDQPRESDMRSLISAPPSYFGPEDLPSTRLDARYQPTINFSGYASEESGRSTYQGEANASNRQGQIQNEISASTGPYSRGDNADATQRAGAREEGYAIPGTAGNTPRAENTFEHMHGQDARSEEEERVLNAAAAREVGREMEALSFNKHRRNSLPQSVRSTVTDELRSNSPALGADDTRVTMPTPHIPFGKQTISPQSSFERLEQSSVAPTQSQAYQSPLIQARQNAPLYDSDIPLPSPTTPRHHFPTAPSSPLLNTMPSFAPLSNSVRGSPEQPFSPAPRVSKVSSTSSLPASGRTIPAAAFKRVIPRKGSESTVGEKRQHSISPNPQSQLQSPVVPLVRERANSESRPLPTPPQQNRDTDYSGGRFVTNLEDEWR